MESNSWSDVAYLRHLDVSHNRLSGHISNNFGDIDELHFFDASYNKLDGFIPLFVADLCMECWCWCVCGEGGAVRCYCQIRTCNEYFTSMVMLSIR